MDTVITMYVDLRENFVQWECTCRARHHYMHFTSPRFAVGIHIQQRCVVLEVGFSRPCGKALSRNVLV